MPDHEDDHSNVSRALILWRPTHLFFPPVQEPPPPKRIFRHIDLEEERPGKRRSIYFRDPNEKHTPDHEIALPELVLNGTFRQLIFGIPKALPYRSYPQASPSHTTHGRQNLTRLSSSTFPIQNIDDQHAMEPDPHHPWSPKKRPLTQQIVLERKGVDNENVFAYAKSFHRNFNGTHKVVPTRIDSDEEARMEQWRVGKRPGHQGSFRTPNRLPDEDETPPKAKKRSLSQSIASSAERVLKKPFRPPTRTSPLKPATSRARSDSPPKSPLSLRPDSPRSLPTYRPQTSFKSPVTSSKQIIPFPDFRSSVPSRNSFSSPRSGRPFKTPVRSTAPSPSTQASHYAHSGSGGDSHDHAQAVGLQNEILILKKAIKYNDGNDESHLQSFIHQWRNAGRDIVERLFSIIPRPTQGDTDMIQSQMATTRSNGYDPSTPRTSYWSEQGNHFSAAPGLSMDQIECIRNAPTNEDGEPVDEEGNLLIPDGGATEEEMKRYIFGLREKKSYFQGQFSSQRSSGTSAFGFESDAGDSSTPVPSIADPTEWHYGTLMQALGVDPSLLGWDNVNEDWVDCTVPVD
ncbi:hypothetical protein IAR55_006982 [Kwoniella newhampshirensis]|uniref:Swi5-dependent recombination DNA repair protein 1 n=1 Tax=Kwoniella newhampshirensis TaxID=1651941 RepID=A0AAW0YSQ2_9TREE